jgi:hypothetical protein
VDRPESEFDDDSDEDGLDPLDRFDTVSLDRNGEIEAGAM